MAVYFNVQLSKRIPDLCSVYTAELIALLLALTGLEMLNHPTQLFSHILNLGSKIIFFNFMNSL